MARAFDIHDRFWLLGSSSGSSNPFAAYIRDGSSAALLFDSGAGLYGLDSVAKPISEVMPITRASVKTFVNSAGLLETAAIDTIAVDHHPITLLPRGVRLEDAATNIFLNSDTASTQTIAVADAATYTLHFTGAGTVTLSGADTTVLVGTGAGEANRVAATFTTAGTSLTLTVTGSVLFAQLEAGSSPSSYISTGATAVTRAKDVAVIPTSAFGFSATSGTVVTVWEAPKQNYQRAWQIDDGSNTQVIGLYRQPSGGHSAWIANGAVVADIVGGTSSAYGPHGSAIAWALNDGAHSVNGGVSAIDTAMTIPTVTGLYFGNRGSGGRPLNGWLKKLIYYPVRLSNATLEGDSPP